MTFAKKTKCSVGRTQDEIRKTLAKHSASAFAFAESIEMAQVQFELKNRRIKMSIPLDVKNKTKNSKGYLMDEKSVEQSTRTKWRCLLLSIKAKLESIENKITSFDQEFMAHIVLPNGTTVGDLVIPEIEYSYQNNKMPPLLGFRKVET